MKETAFHLALAGIVAFFIGSILAALRARLETWFCVAVGLNFFTQSYMVLEKIGFPYICVPNVILIVFVIFVYRKWIKQKEQNP